MTVCVFLLFQMVLNGELWTSSRCTSVTSSCHPCLASGGTKTEHRTEGKIFNSFRFRNTCWYRYRRQCSNNGRQWRRTTFKPHGVKLFLLNPPNYHETLHSILFFHRFLFMTIYCYNDESIMEKRLSFIRTLSPNFQSTGVFTPLDTWVRRHWLGRRSGLLRERWSGNQRLSWNYCDRKFSDAPSSGHLFFTI